MEGWFQKQAKAFAKKIVNKQEILTSFNPVPAGNIRLGDTLVIKCAHERKNQLESEPLFPETELTSRPQTKEIFELTDFQIFRKKLARQVFVAGQMYVIPVPFNGSFVLDSWKITYVDRVGSYIRWIECTTSTTIIVKNEPIVLSAKVEFVDGSTIVTYFYPKIEDPTQLVVFSQTVYKATKKMVGRIFTANEDAKPEVEYAELDGKIEYLNYLSQEPIEESFKTKTWYTINTNYADNKTPEDMETELRSGKSVTTEDSFNQKLQSGQAVTISGSQATTFAQIQYNFYEDKFKEYLGVMRDTTSTGANKQSLEVAGFNQYATETLLSIRSIRENDYKALFDCLAELTGETSLAPVTELKLSKIEQAKLMLLDQKTQQKTQPSK